MAKQKGSVKLSGTIGDISFYEAGSEFLAKAKGGPSREQVLTKKGFERTRENASEFGRCSQAGKLLRSALQPLYGPLTDPTAATRLNGRLVRVLHSDTVSPRGQRTLQKGSLAILEGFEFLSEARLTDTLFVRYSVVINRPEGCCTVHLPSFLPKPCLRVPPHATGVKIVATALAIDFEKGTTQRATAASEPLPLDNTPTGPLTLTCRFEGASALPVIVVLGVQFTEQHEGFCYPMREKEFNSYPMREKEFNSMAIVRTDGGN